MVTRSQGQGARSNSCLTSAHSDYQAWRQARRHETAVVKKMTGPGGSLTSSCNSSSSSNSSAAAAAAAAGKQGASKLLGRLSQYFGGSDTGVMGLTELAEAVYDLIASQFSDNELQNQVEVCR